MANIQFYQLPTCDPQQIHQLTCDLLYQYHLKNHFIYVLCPSQEYLYQLDEYIITYQETNFFPYQILGEGPIPPAPITLGTVATQQLTLKLKYDILVNLNDIIPDNFNKYKKILEFVPSDTQHRAIAREHYKHYSKYNCQITTDSIPELIAELVPEAPE